jgi:hypothetical protein
MRAWLAALLLASFFSPPSVKAESGEKRVIPITRLGPGHGMVMVRILSNREFSTYPFKWDAFDVQDLKTRKNYRIRDLYGAGHHATFVASLPPGDYQAEFGFHAGSKVESASADPWRFKVEPGRMTNLGTLLFLQLYIPAPLTDIFLGTKYEYRYRWVHVPDENLPQRNAFLFHEDDYPTALSKSLGWATVPANATLTSVPAKFKRMTLALAGATATIRGGTLFGEHFGQIAWRHADGNWTWEDTGTIESILAVADTLDGTRYAAAEGSMLLKRVAPGDWRRVSVDLEDATPRLMYAYGDGSLLTVWEQFGRCTALRYRPNANPAWTKEWEVPAPSGKVKKDLGYYNAMQSSRGLLFSTEAFGFGLSTHSLAVLDFTTGQWRISEPEFKGSIGLMPDGALYSMTGGKSNQTFKVSNDHGRTWQTRSTGTNLLAKPQFRTGDEGFTIYVEQQTAWRLLRTTDGGRNWRVVTGLPKHTNWFLVLPGQEILVATEAGELYASLNDGKEWRLERDANAAR